MIIQGVSYLSDFEAKKSIIAAASRLYKRGWMIAGDGSLSVKVGPNAIWMTTEGADKSELTQDQLVRIDLNGKQPATNKPKPLGDDTETHLRIYKENDRVRSIIHAYPIASLKLDAGGRHAEAAAFTPAVRRLGRVQMVGSLKNEHVISDVSLLAKNDNGVIVHGDGCMMWGKTPQEAADYVEVLNYYCEAVFALSDGKVQGLSMANTDVSGFVPLLVPNCTSDCSVCGNAVCKERRMSAEPYSKLHADEYTAPHMKRYTSENEKSCDGRCEECLFTACAERKTSINNGNPSGCENSVRVYGDRETLNEKYNSSILPSGMTGIIRPGEALPDIPDESSGGVTVKDDDLRTKAADASVNTAPDVFFQKLSSEEAYETGIPSNVTRQLQADNKKKTYGRTFTDTDNKDDVMPPGVCAFGTANAGSHSEKQAACNADVPAKNVVKAQVMANVIKHLTGI